MWGDELGEHWEELPQEVVMEVEMRNTPSCGRNDVCGWGSVGVVMLVGALVVSKIDLTASQNLTVHWRCLREQHCGDLSLRPNKGAQIGI